MSTAINRNPLTGTAFTRNWQILKDETPASAIHPNAKTWVSHNRNCRIWVSENAATAAHPNVKNAHELRRFFQTIAKEL